MSRTPEPPPAGNGTRSRFGAGVQAPSDVPVRRDTIVIGTSAGGHKALAKLFQALPQDLPAAIFVVLHYPVEEASSVLTRIGGLPAVWARNGDKIQMMRAYIAPAERHMVLKPGMIQLIHGPRENRFRPAIDPLFRSAAIAFGPRVIAVILTGLLDDGTAGALAVKKCGGIAIAQDPEEAEFPDMPRSAIKHVQVDHTLPLVEIGRLLAELTTQEVDPSAFKPVPHEVLIEQSILEQAMRGMEGNMELGAPSQLTCPDCNGVLWHLREGNLVRYRCQVGHSYTADSMYAEQTQELENSLWAALRAFEERRKLCESMARNSREQGLDRAAHAMESRAEEAKQHGDALRTILLNGRELDQQQRPTIQEHAGAETAAEMEIVVQQRRAADAAARKRSRRP